MSFAVASGSGSAAVGPGPGPGLRPSRNARNSRRGPGGSGWSGSVALSFVAALKHITKRVARMTRDMRVRGVWKSEGKTWTNPDHLDPWRISAGFRCHRRGPDPDPHPDPPGPSASAHADAADDAQPAWPDAVATWDGKDMRLASTTRRPDLTLPDRLRPRRCSLDRGRSVTISAEVEAMRRRPWHQHGAATLLINEIRDPLLRQAVTNEAVRRWRPRNGEQGHGL